MNLKVLASICFVLLLSLMTGCSNMEAEPKGWRDNLENHGMTRDDFILGTEYTETNFFNNFAEFEEPQSIMRVENNIVVSDSKLNCLFVFNNDGDFIEKVGATGNGDLEFLYPMGLAYKDDVLYVVDSGNHRIQFVSKNFEYLGEKKLNNLNSVNPYSHIEIDDDNIYLSVAENVESKYSFIYKISGQDNRVYQIGLNSVGCLRKSNDSLYFINTWEKTISQTFNGKNYLYKIEDDKLVEEFELPYGIMAKDLFFKDNYLYILDGRNSSVDKFELSGTYVETIYQCPLENTTNDSEVSFLYYDEVSENVFISIPNKSKIICISD